LAEVIRLTISYVYIRLYSTHQQLICCFNYHHCHYKPLIGHHLTKFSTALQCHDTNTKLSTALQCRDTNTKLSAALQCHDTNTKLSAALQCHDTNTKLGAALQCHDTNTKMEQYCNRLTVRIKIHTMTNKIEQAFRLKSHKDRGNLLKTLSKRGSF